MPVSLSSLYAPTAAAIVTAGTAAGWGSLEPQWTLITSSTTAASSYTFSSISGYRMIRIVIKDPDNTGGNLKITFNGSTSGYSGSYVGVKDGTSSHPTASNINSDAIYLTRYNMTTGNHAGGFIDVYEVNTTLPYKRVKSTFVSNASVASDVITEADGTWKNTNAITSILISNINVSQWNTTSGGIAIYGAN